MSMMREPESLTRAGFEQAGAAVIPGVFSDVDVSQMAAAIDEARSKVTARHRRNDMYAMRDVHRAVALFAQGELLERLRAIATDLLGRRAFVTRSLLFDKPAGANWGIRWHQDTTIAVRSRRDVDGFGPWSVKAGLPHVRAPAAVLAGMVALRVHLDECGGDNGALIVIPGGHREGRVDTARLASIRESSEARVLTCRAGDVIAMRPLLPHASRPATSPRHRRVVHLEFACDALPGGLEWNDCA